MILPSVSMLLSMTLIVGRVPPHEFCYGDVSKSWTPFVSSSISSSLYHTSTTSSHASLGRVFSLSPPMWRASRSPIHAISRIETSVYRCGRLPLGSTNSQSLAIPVQQWCYAAFAVCAARMSSALPSLIERLSSPPPYCMKSISDDKESLHCSEASVRDRLRVVIRQGVAR